MEDGKASYYRERARASLTQSTTARSPEAARIHMELYQLYTERADSEGMLPDPATALRRS